jgi:hypothetical protein
MSDGYEADRVLELAKQAAKDNHDTLTCGFQPLEGHDWSGFEHCAHPDCVLVRSGDALQAAPGAEPPKETT